jgi:hypothetical protein
MFWEFLLDFLVRLRVNYNLTTISVMTDGAIILGKSNIHRCFRG